MLSGQVALSKEKEMSYSLQNLKSKRLGLIAKKNDVSEEENILSKKSDEKLKDGDKIRKSDLKKDPLLKNKLNKTNKSKKSKKSKKYLPHTEILGLSNNNSRDIGLLNFFIPLKQSSNSLFFTDLRGQMDNQSTNEYNIGLGYRKLRKDHILGAYMYYDHRRGKSNEVFNALTFGAERLGQTYDARVNLYVPRDQEGFIENSAKASIENSKVQVAYDTEKPLMGTDFEIGRKLPIGNTRAFLGANYYFKDKEVGVTYKSLHAATSRLETKLFSDRLALGTILSYNQDSDLDANIYARFRLTFGDNKFLSPLEKRMTDTIIRDLDIVSNITTNVTQDVSINGIDMNSSTIIDITDLSGSELADAIADNTSSNQLVKLIGSNEEDFTTALTPKENQAIMSGNSLTSLSYNTRFGDRSTDLILSGERAELNFDGSTNGIEFTDESNNSSVIGLTINDAYDGIYMVSTNNITAYADDLIFGDGDGDGTAIYKNGIYFYNSNSSNNTLDVGSFVIDGDIIGNDFGSGILFNNNSSSNNNTLNVDSFVINGNIANIYGNVIKFKNNNSNNNTLNIGSFDATGNIGGNGIYFYNSNSSNNNTLNVGSFEVVGDIGAYGIDLRNNNSSNNTMNISSFVMEGDILGEWGTGIIFHNKNFSNNNTLNISSFVMEGDILGLYGDGIYFNNYNSNDNSFDIENFKVTGNIQRYGIYTEGTDNNATNNTTSENNTLNITNFSLLTDSDKEMFIDASSMGTSINITNRNVPNGGDDVDIDDGSDGAVVVTVEGEIINPPVTP
jgi:hypothetical protein